MEVFILILNIYVLGIMALIFIKPNDLVCKECKGELTPLYGDLYVCRKCGRYYTHDKKAHKLNEIQKY